MSAMVVQHLEVTASIAEQPTHSWIPRSRRFWALTLLAIAILAAAGAPLADGDSFGDLVSSFTSVASGIGAVRWQFLPILVAVAALHYLCASLALRAAAGSRLPLGLTTLAQLAASTANRLTPAGLGGAAVNIRFLSRLGAGTASAVGAVASLGVLGSVADLLLITVLVVGGSYVGLSGGHAELTSLGSHLTHLVSLPTLTPTAVVPIASVASLVVAIALVAQARGRGRGTLRLNDRRRSRLTALRDAFRHMADIARRPRDLVALLLASAGTTLLLGVALAVSVRAIPGHVSGSSFGMVIIAYMLGAAAGAAVPVPAGIGSTETALVAAMVVAHVPAGHALQSVLLFRLITFWVPALAGLPAARALRAQGAL